MRYIALILTLCFSSCLHASPLTACVNKLIKPLSHTQQVGFIVQDVLDGNVIYRYNAHQYFTPASVEKILTAISSLSALGPNYRFKTQLFFNPKAIKKDTLTQPLYIRFSGDPTLSDRDLNAMADALVQYGIHRIQSTIVLDNSAFSRPYHANGWVTDDLHICYAAPISGIILNKNCVRANIAAGTKQTKIRLSQAKIFTLEDTVHVAPKNTSAPCVLNIRSDETNQVNFYGCMTRYTQLPLKLSVKNPRLYFQQRFDLALLRANIVFEGDYSIGQPPAAVKARYTNQSPPLSAILSHMLLTSNNIEAEAILRTMGAKQFKQPGSWDNGIAAMKSTLTRIAHLEPSHLHLYDGSGLSIYNRLTPAQLNKVLIAAYFQDDFNVFYAMLPTLGKTGTLSHYEVIKEAYRIRAKTGSMTGIRNLAGYLTPYLGHPLAFTLMINGAVDRNIDYRATQDAILRCVAENLTGIHSLTSPVG